MSTLTFQGRAFSSQTGQGLALINFYLLDANGSPLEWVHLAPVPRPDKGNLEDLRFCPVGTAELKRNHKFRLRVVVINTTLEISYVHEWIELSLNQSLLSWTIERHLERSRKGILHPLSASAKDELTRRDAQKLHEKWSTELGAVCPGLPLLSDILHSAVSLPHPAVCIVQSNALLRGTMARVVFELLERAILAPIFGDGKKYLSSNAHNVTILRATGLEKPHVVRLSRGRQEGEALITDGRGRAIVDSPVEGVEYTVVFGLRCRDDEGTASEEIFGLAPAYAKVFKEVMIESHGADGKAEEFEARIAEIKASCRKDAFVRSLAFVLIVNRTTQYVLGYNWHPTVVQESRRRFAEIERETNSLISHNDHALLRRCLGPLIKERRVSSVSTKGVSTGESNMDVIPSQRVVADNTEHLSAQLGPKRDAGHHVKNVAGQEEKRIVRPTLIRRPKLIGASVEGAAQQALLASRARASTRPVRFQRKVPASNKQLLSSHRLIDARARIDSTDSLSSLPSLDSLASLKNKRLQLAPSTDSRSVADNTGVVPIQKKITQQPSRRLTEAKDVKESTDLVQDGAVSVSCSNSRDGLGKTKGRLPFSNRAETPPLSDDAPVESTSKSPKRRSVNAVEAVGTRDEENGKNNAKLLATLARNTFNEWFSASPIPEKIPIKVLRLVAGRLVSSTKEIGVLAAALPFAGVVVQTVVAEIPSFLLDKIEPAVTSETCISAFLNMYHQYLCSDYFYAESISNQSSPGRTQNIDHFKDCVRLCFLKKEIHHKMSKALLFLELSVKRHSISTEVVALVTVWMIPLMMLNDDTDLTKKTRKRRVFKRRPTNLLFLDASVRRCVVGVIRRRQYFHFATVLKIHRHFSFIISCIFLLFMLRPPRLNSD